MGYCSRQSRRTLWHKPSQARKPITIFRSSRPRDLSKLTRLYLGARLGIYSIALLVKRIQRCPGIFEFWIECEGALVNSLSFCRASLLLQRLTQPEVGLAGG